MKTDYSEWLHYATWKVGVAVCLIRGLEFDEEDEDLGLRGKKLAEFKKYQSIVFDNLLQNKIEGRKKEGLLRLTFEPEPEEYLIEVKSLLTWAYEQNLLVPQPLIEKAELFLDKTPKQPRKPRGDQIDRVAVQAVARCLWNQDKTMTITAMTEHKWILTYANGGLYEKKTLHGWIKEVDPRPMSEKSGRPKKTPV